MVTDTHLHCYRYGGTLNRCGCYLVGAVGMAKIVLTGRDEKGILKPAAGSGYATSKAFGKALKKSSGQEKAVGKVVTGNFIISNNLMWMATSK